MKRERPAQPPFKKGEYTYRDRTSKERGKVVVALEKEKSLLASSRRGRSRSRRGRKWVQGGRKIPI